MKFVSSAKVVSAFIVFTMAVSFNAEQASALELVNDAGLLAVLKKNQVLSARDLDAINNEYPKMEIKGSAQLQFIKANNVNELDMRRLNLTFVGRVSDKVSMYLEPEYGKALPATRDAYIAFKSPVFGVYAGNHRVPFSAEVLQNDINLRFVERNLTSQISPDRMLGVSVLKTLFDNKLIAQAGIWNTNLNSKAQSDLLNNNLADNQIFSPISGTAGNSIFIRAFRVAYFSTGRDEFYSRVNGFKEDENFSGEKSIGAGFSFYNSGSASANPTPGLTGLNGAKAYEFDLLLRGWKLTGEFEYANRNLEWWQFNNQSISVPVGSLQTSYSIQASYLLNESLSVVLRQESFVYDGNGKVLKGVYGQDQDKWLTTGLNYYSKEHNTKIQANYIWKQAVMPVGTGSLNNNTLLVQGTTYF